MSKSPHRKLSLLLVVFLVSRFFVLPVAHADTISISSCNDLPDFGVGASYYGDYVLTQDIDCTDHDFSSGTFGTLTGSFDGQGHKISNIRFGSGSSFNSLFIYDLTPGSILKNVTFDTITADHVSNANGLIVRNAEGATIENVQVKNVLFTGSTIATSGGGLFGYMSDSTTISQVKISGTNSINANGLNAGGIFGRVENSTIFQVEITGNNTINVGTSGGVFIGHLVDGTISEVQITGENNFTLHSNGGGFIGHAYMGIGSDSSINNCSVDDDITMASSSFNGGGFIGALTLGASSTSIAHNYVAGSMTTTGTDGGTNGGFIGRNYEEGAVALLNYNIVAATVNFDTAALTNFVNVDVGADTDYTTDYTTTQTCVGGNGSGGDGVGTCAQTGMTASSLYGSSSVPPLNHWDFSTIWEKVTGGMPALLFFNPTITEVTPVSSPINDSTPNYVFNSSKPGTIVYGGDCSSSTTTATAGENIITFNALADGTHSNCTISVTDSLDTHEMDNATPTLNVSSFTVDTAAPTAAITYSPSQASYKLGDSVTITATFDEAMVDAPVPKIAISGSNTLAATPMIKTDSTHYTYLYTVGSGNGMATVDLSIGTDVVGNVITSAPTSGSTFTVARPNGGGSLPVADELNKGRVVPKSKNSVTTTASSTSQKPVPFTDISGSFAFDAITKLYNANIVTGITATKFQPNANLTRAEALKIIMSALKYPVKKDLGILQQYGDIDLNAWYAPYISTAVKNNIAVGYGDHNFKPDAPISRAECVKMLLLTMGGTLNNPKSSPFVDVSSEAWFKKFIDYAYILGLIKGESPTIFAPNLFMTRAEMVVMIVSAMSMTNS